MTVSLDSHNILQLACNDDEKVGFRDKFCTDNVAGGHLVLNFDRGLDGKDYGLQPGSRYWFDEVMFIENIWHQSVDVFVRVEQEVDGNLYQVLTVKLTDAAGDDHLMLEKGILPSDKDTETGTQGTNKTISMAPGETASLNFAFDVDDHWADQNNASFDGPDSRFKLEGAVIVRIEIDEEEEEETPGPGSGRRPRPSGTSTFPDSEFEVEEDEEDPVAGPLDPGDGDEPSAEVELVEEEPAAGPPLPRTGGSTLPYVLLGLLLMAAGAVLYVRNREPAS